MTYNANDYSLVTYKHTIKAM